jgi:hypothetical protein
VWIHIDEQTPAEQKGGNPLFLKAVVIFVILLAASLAIKVAVQGPTNGHGMSGPGPAYAVMTTAGVSTSVRLSTWPTEDELAHIADALRPSLAAGDRALIFFYLPLSFGDSPGAPWARAKFAPKTTIEVYGFTPKSLAKAAALADQIPDQIGAWMWNQGAGSEVIVISTKQGQLMRTDLNIGGDSLKYSPIRCMKPVTCRADASRVPIPPAPGTTMCCSPVAISCSVIKRVLSRPLSR